MEEEVVVEEAAKPAAAKPAAKKAAGGGLFAGLLGKVAEAEAKQVCGWIRLVGLVSGWAEQRQGQKRKAVVRWEGLPCSADTNQLQTCLFK